MKILCYFFDRIYFSVIFILGVQLPEFIQQYLQRLAGHLDEAKYQLAQFKFIAEQHFNGDILTMAQSYQANQNITINQMGDMVLLSLERVRLLEWQLQILQQDHYIWQVGAFLFEFDLSLVIATLLQYQLAIPLTLTAILTGAVFVVLVIVIHLLVKPLMIKAWQSTACRSLRHRLVPSKLKTL